MPPRRLARALTALMKKMKWSAGPHQSSNGAGGIGVARLTPERPRCRQSIIHVTCHGCRPADAALCSRDETELTAVCFCPSSCISMRAGGSHSADLGNPRLRAEGGGWGWGVAGAAGASGGGAQKKRGNKRGAKRQIKVGQRLSGRRPHTRSTSVCDYSLTCRLRLPVYMDPP